MIESLQKLLRPEQVSTLDEVLETHSIDKWDASHLPDVVVFAESTEDVAKVLRYANDNNIPVTTLAHAHLLAERALAPGAVIAGKAYFVSDEEPAAFFDFVRPFLEGMGKGVPRFSVPAAPIYHTMCLWQWLHFKCGFPPPMLTPHEINKAAISHVVYSDAAARDFGYAPVISVADGMTEAVAYFRAKRGMD